MSTPPLDANFAPQAIDVKSTYFLDVLPERDFDQLTYLTTNICKAPIALITFFSPEGIHLKSQYGLDSLTISKDLTDFCKDTISQGDINIIRDIPSCDRFRNNKFARRNGIIFYAGVPIINPNGETLGVLCILDRKIRNISKRQRTGMYSLAYQTSRLFKVRKFNRTMLQIQEELKERNEELKNFAGIVSHDMKMPLANIILTSDILKSKYEKLLDDQGKEYLGYLKQSALTLSDYITGILAHYESDKTAAGRKEIFDTHDLFEEVIDLLSISDDCEINFPEDNIEMNANRMAIQQILINLLTNSLKYTDKKQTKIDIACNDIGNFYRFKVSDNGQGIEEDDISRIFELFATTKNEDKSGRKGNGIGLSTVRNLVRKLEGEIKVFSKVGEGTTFEFTVAK